MQLLTWGLLEQSGLPQQVITNDHSNTQNHVFLEGNDTTLYRSLVRDPHAPLFPLLAACIWSFSQMV